MDACCDDIEAISASVRVFRVVDGQAELNSEGTLYETDERVKARTRYFRCNEPGTRLITTPILVLRRTSGNSSVRYTSSKPRGVRQPIYRRGYGCTRIAFTVQVHVAPAFPEPPAATKLHAEKGSDRLSESDRFFCRHVGLNNRSSFAKVNDQTILMTIAGSSNNMDSRFAWCNSVPVKVNVTIQG